MKASEEERSSSPDRERSRGRSSGQSIDFLIYVMGRPFFEKALPSSIVHGRVRPKQNQENTSSGYESEMALAPWIL